jgi:hypothetical protein
MYAVWGPTRSWCGHVHRTVNGARRCRADDRSTVLWRRWVNGEDLSADRRVYRSADGALGIGGWYPRADAAPLRR